METIQETDTIAGGTLIRAHLALETIVRALHSPACFSSLLLCPVLLGLNTLLFLEFSLLARPIDGERRSIGQRSGWSGPIGYRPPSQHTYCQVWYVDSNRTDKRDDNPASAATKYALANASARFLRIAPARLLRIAPARLLRVTSARLFRIRHTSSFLESPVATNRTGPMQTPGFPSTAPDQACRTRFASCPDQIYSASRRSAREC